MIGAVPFGFRRNSKGWRCGDANMWWRCPDSIQCLHRRLSNLNNLFAPIITYYTTQVLAMPTWVPQPPGLPGGGDAADAMQRCFLETYNRGGAEKRGRRSDGGHSTREQSRRLFHFLDCHRVYFCFAPASSRPSGCGGGGDARGAGAGRRGTSAGRNLSGLEDPRSVDG